MIPQTGIRTHGGNFQCSNRPLTQILMHLKPERSTFEFDPNGIIINTNNAETNVIVSNGETAVIAGLTTQDEVSSEIYPKVQVAINELSQRLNQLGDGNIIVLTMRTQFHQQIKGAYHEAFPHATFLEPFTPTDIYEFLSRWHFT
ncbi:MAG: hypothetical protein IIC63_06190, partial [Proteobacteria bacterium]|nr:hypothetical protein [Pseudomonadota bacterium]